MQEFEKCFLITKFLDINKNPMLKNRCLPLKERASDG